ncbi:TPR repeat-containing protein [Salegentibacter agarivorans]|uniref:TPR repeat-containing protein n=1 Tax=Salegentibacter agarivorans TaxID=345907 RepID=A0A1I2MUF5_9FLAO|nr:tetratricopeptide repeat protein [Salegentibacter agarivorans]SFF95215.1 TPR repeat-containing protein [Salegentibacter agarivorans]
MKKIFKILKILLTVLFTSYSIFVILFLFFSDKEKRYDFASHLQGDYLSQSMFEILKLQNPQNDEIYFEQSVPYNKRGFYKEGFQLLNKAVELKPKMHLGYRGYMKLRFLRDFKGALKDFNRLDSLTPNFVDSPWGEDIDFLMGEAYFGLEKYDKAITHFGKSIENQGEGWVDIQAFVYTGLSEYKLGNFDEAKIQFEKALSQSKYTVEAHLGLAKIYLETGDLTKGKLHLDKAEKYFSYKRNDPYNEYLNEVYESDIVTLRSSGT